MIPIPCPTIRIGRRFFMFRRWKCEWGGITGWGKTPADAFWDWFKKLHEPLMF